MLRCFRQGFVSLICGIATCSMLGADTGLSASGQLEVVKMVYAQAEHYQDQGRLSVTLEPSRGEKQMLTFTFNTLFARTGPFRYEFRGETHPEVILIRSDGRVHGFYWSNAEDEVPLPDIAQGLLQAAPVTRGLSRWVPALLLADTPIGMSVLDAQNARMLEKTTVNGRPASHLLLDEGTPAERSLWIDEKTFLILKLESRRSTPQGEIQLSAVYEPELDQEVMLSAYTEGVLPPEDTVLQVRTSDEYAVPAQGEVVATVFGEDLRLEDLYPDGVPEEEVVRRELGTVLGERVFQILTQVFMDARGYTASDAERDEYVDYQVRRLAANKDYLQSQYRVGENLAAEERQALQRQIAEIDRQLSNRSELEAQLREDADAMIRLWKLNRDLYERYGGRVLQSGVGPEPIGAYREFVEEQIEAGRVVIPRDDLLEGMWNVFEPQISYEIPPSQVDFSRPWWQLGRQ